MRIWGRTKLPIFHRLTNTIPALHQKDPLGFFTGDPSAEMENLKMMYLSGKTTIPTKNDVNRRTNEKLYHLLGETKIVLRKNFGI
jgi:hypothetical protein